MRQTAHAKPDAAPFLNERELLTIVPISRRTLYEWRKAGTIPWINAKGRRVLFHYPSVEAALLRLQKPAIG